MKKILIRILFALTVSSAFSISCAASTKEEYELQERCGKSAEDDFRREWKNGIVNTKDGQMISDFTNHYNKNLNKCFVLQTTTNISNKGGISTSFNLYDINEHKGYGSFFKLQKSDKPNMCDVSGIICHSESEWKVLIKPYMEE